MCEFSVCQSTISSYIFITNLEKPENKKARRNIISQGINQRYFKEADVYVFIKYSVKRKKSLLRLQSKLGKRMTIGFISIAAASEWCHCCVRKNTTLKQFFSGCTYFIQKVREIYC